MRELLNNIDWEKELKKYTLNVNKKLTFFKKKFYEAEKLCMPPKLVVIKEKFFKKFSIPLDEKKMKKLKTNKMWTKIRKDLANEAEKLHYKTLSNQVRMLTHKGKNHMKNSNIPSPN